MNIYLNTEIESMNETLCRSNIPHKIRYILQERVRAVVAATSRVSQPCLVRYFRITLRCIWELPLYRSKSPRLLDF